MRLLRKLEVDLLLQCYGKSFSKSVQLGLYLYQDSVPYFIVFKQEIKYFNYIFSEDCRQALEYYRQEKINQSASRIQAEWRGLTFRRAQAKRKKQQQTIRQHMMKRQLYERRSVREERVQRVEREERGGEERTERGRQLRRNNEPKPR